ncbi:PREDICTED: uncharacterized protein LOC109361818 [Lupinus angustifolius]|uniref:uncharacterized protein LOC109361818 n=1 Tax=Lupinus angustifolius TaxID=3871 RepID=UPI00092ED3C8|nr:PREDICTED: uncharacterized protein LOC109361818 [Lupinus angustifolius]
MSNIISLLLFFLCISLHACDARPLSTVDKKLEMKYHFSLKSGEKSVFDSYPKQLNESNSKIETQLVDYSEKPKDHGNTSQKVVKSTVEASVALKTESLVTVSMHVQHKKPLEEHPQFNLDYAPPKTHPPHHN